MAIKFLDVKYKDIFENLNLEITKDEITSVVGKNGSGKTTFLNLVYGLEQDFEGKITIGRKSITSNTKNKDVEAIRLNIAYLIQDYQNQLFNVTVLEDIKYGLYSIDIDKLGELLKLFGLNEEILKRGHFELSDGEKKKVLIIKMFMRNSKVILMDDPTGGLDQKSIGTLIKLLKKEKRKDKIIIIASQDSEFLMKVSDKILIIDNKKMVTKEKKQEFFCDKINLKNCGLKMSDVSEFRQKVLNKKHVKLVYRDNINDLLKDIYRSVK